MTEKVTLHVEFGPVQPFIAEARRTRDLWAGSYILSYLMAHALCAACKAGVVLKQPAVDHDALFRAVQAWRERQPLPPLETATRIGSLPDRFEGEAQDVPHAEAIAEAAVSAWFDTWLHLADHSLVLSRIARMACEPRNTPALERADWHTQPACLLDSPLDHRPLRCAPLSALEFQRLPWPGRSGGRKIHPGWPTDRAPCRPDASPRRAPLLDTYRRATRVL